MISKLPSVLSSQRGTIVSDGIMYSMIPSDGPEHVLKEISVIRHGIRGINIKKGASETALVQRTESAKTSPKATGLMVKFDFKTISSKSLLFACSEPSYRVHLESFIDRFFVPGIQEFDEVCRRMARNILNGRWLWRNRVLGDVSVKVKVGEHSYSGHGSSLHHFDNYTPDEISLATNVIQAGFMGSHLVATVHGKIDLGFTGAVEVFPSQNMVTDKPKGFARSLYKVDMINRKELISILSKKDAEDSGEFSGDMIVMGTAALRDQKISNAIKTIDTWHAVNGDLLEDKVEIISIEPNGASLEHNKFYRNAKNDAKSILSKIDEMHPSEGSFNPQAAYLIGLLIRGGVFSEKSE